MTRFTQRTFGSRRHLRDRLLTGIVFASTVLVTDVALCAPPDLDFSIPILAPTLAEQKAAGLTAQAVLQTRADELDEADGPRLDAVPKSQREIVVPETGNEELDVAFQPAETNASSGAEIVRDRFPKGGLRAERQVILDSTGNYVNHGDYTEWNEAGEIVATGRYMMGQREGAWVKYCRGKDAKMFSAYPYSQFKPPFQSTAEFLGGQLHGVWTIMDAEHRPISEITLSAGVRDGSAKWHHPTGVVMYEATYVGGVLDGTFIERDAKGNEVRNEKFVQGQSKEYEREYYDNKAVKSEFEYMSRLQVLTANDDWWLGIPAAYKAEGERVKHGTFTVWYENGQMKTKGSYLNGVLNGKYESWHENGQCEALGDYQMGKQQAEWTWWHNNGMRRSTGTYEDGKPIGSWSSWQADGKKILESVAATQGPKTIGKPPEVRSGPTANKQVTRPLNTTGRTYVVPRNRR